jgi:hypothetical protein
MAEPQGGQVGRDRVSFFIFPRSEVAPVVYDYAYTMVEGKTPQQMPDKLRDTFSKTVDGARSMAPDTVGPGYYLAWVRAASGRGPAHPDPRLPLIG